MGGFGMSSRADGWVSTATISLCFGASGKSTRRAWRVIRAPMHAVR